DQRGGGFAGGVADGRDEGDIAHTHRRPLPYAESRRFGGWGSDLLADVPEEVDQRDAGTADDGGAAGDEDADLPPTGQMRVGGVGAEAPHDRQDGQDEADGHDGADDGAQLGDTGQA